MSGGPRYRLPRLILLLAEGEPTMVTLTAQLGIDRRSIEKDLVALEDGGILIDRIQSSGGDRPGRQPTRYRLADATRLRIRP